MFEEKTINGNKKIGWIEVITGSMFSGKTEELIRRLRRAQIAKQKVEIFKPVIDDRYSKNEVVSHNYNAIPSETVDNCQTILEKGINSDVIGIDEVQFFDKKIIEVCNTLANNGVRVIIAGLDMDYKGNPFGPIPQLLAIAEYVTKVHAICMRCGNPAQYSHRLSSSNNIIEVGESDKYEPLCRTCFNEATKK